MSEAGTIGILVEADAGPGVLHTLSGVIAAHDGDITLVEIIENRPPEARIYFEMQLPGEAAQLLADLEKLAGYGRDINKSRAEAKRLLKEAGVPDGFTFTYKNRGVPMPYEPLGVWLIDQWRQIGLTVKQEVIEAAKYYAELRGGNFEVAADFQCGYIVEPDLDLYKFQSKEKSPANYSRYTDPVLDELYEKQGKAIDTEERKKHIREFERRLLDEEVHYIYTLQCPRIVPHSAKVKGWTITPSHYLNQQLDTVWLTE